jgi:hypothetical protein
MAAIQEADVGAINGDGTPVTSLFGAAVPLGTGAGGSAGATGPADAAAAPVTIPFTNTTYEGTGHTAGREQVTGLPWTQADVGHTGAGLGHAQMSHPNAGA